MFQSSTVENYLKAIYQGQLQLPAGARLVPMGQVAAALGVTPGTATTMVKALAESGLAEYEPYSGVRLSAAGEKLAGLVLRRHRLVELFLVQVMGMSWAEVHEEAEQLEHVVSERLIERIDDMLGHPTHDPHGDPIPTPEGRLAAHHADNLLTCPVGIPLKVTRIADQDPSFLRFIEENSLKPGQAIEVEARDLVADAVTLRGRDRPPLVIGTRAASKLLVEVVGLALTVLLAVARTASAQPAAPAPREQSFAVIDNSFFVEEAFNQEPGVVQNIFTWMRGRDGEWNAAFTQEWPMMGAVHQLSYVVPFSGGADGAQLDGLVFNYRYQALTENGTRPAFAPRISVILPSGRNLDPNGQPGVQVNLPFSKQTGDVYWHWNAGVTRQNATTTPQFAGSAIWRTTTMFHLMLESVLSLDPRDTGGRDATLTLAPGFRRGWNIGEHQLVAGLAVPVTNGPDDATTAILTYFSYELPFK
jgi:DtxR family Mn-dependent transcriptional regulator